MNNKDTHQLNSFGQKTHRGANHVQPTAHHAKAVARVLGQGGGRPLGSPDPSPAPLGHPFDRRWHEGMQEAMEHVLAPKIVLYTTFKLV